MQPTGVWFAEVYTNVNIVYHSFFDIYFILFIILDLHLSENIKLNHPKQSQLNVRSLVLKLEC